MVMALAISRDGGVLVSASGDRTVRIWDAPRRACVRMLYGHFGPLSGVAVSPDGKYVYASGGTPFSSGIRDKLPLIYVWEVGTGRCVALLTVSLVYIP